MKIDLKELDPIIRTRKFKNLSGGKFGRLTVLKYLGRKKIGPTSTYYYSAKCICGNIIHVSRTNLTSGATTSCGCVHREMMKLKATHGMSKTKEYSSWKHMLRRCENPKDDGYYMYGAKGISVCEEWHNIENFIKDMGKCPSPSHSIDRIDSSKGYYKDNCRWSTPREQARNTKNNRYLTFRGERKIIQQWATELNIHKNIIISRLRLGWTEEEALSNPVNKRRHIKKIRRGIV